MPANQHNPIVWARIPRLFPDWHIRQYADGTWEAAQITGPALSPGYATFEEAYAWLLDQYAS